jgi:hypothetical protein
LKSGPCRRATHSQRTEGVEEKEGVTGKCQYISKIFVHDLVSLMFLGNPSWNKMLGSPGSE